MDIIHTIANWTEKNRHTVLGLLVLVGVLAFVGCGSFDGRVASSATGKQVDAEGLEREYIATSNTIRGEIERQELIISGAQAVIDAKVLEARRVNDDFEHDGQAIVAELAKRDELVNNTVGAVKLVAPQAANYIDLIFGALGLGATATATGVYLDNRRKDRVIAAKSTPGTGAA